MAWYIDLIIYIWSLFKLWLSAFFSAPFRKPDMLWVLIPVWLGWLFAEFFQEKHKTSIGNAISNSIVVLWGAIDCVRQTVSFIALGVLGGFWDLFFRFFLAALVFFYGIVIVVLGWQGKKVVEYVGRVREVSYVLILIIPFFYDAISFSWNYFVAMLLFFPLFYFIVELIDKITPNPKAIIEDEDGSEDRGKADLGGLSDSDLSMPKV